MIIITLQRYQVLVLSTSMFVAASECRKPHPAPPSLAPMHSSRNRVCGLGDVGHVQSTSQPWAPCSGHPGGPTTILARLGIGGAAETSATEVFPQLFPSSSSGVPLRHVTGGPEKMPRSSSMTSTKAVGPLDQLDQLRGGRTRTKRVR